MLDCHPITHLGLSKIYESISDRMTLLPMLGYAFTHPITENAVVITSFRMSDRMR
jgi:hypothetical protein